MDKTHTVYAYLGWLEESISHMSVIFTIFHAFLDFLELGKTKALHQNTQSTLGSSARPQQQRWTVRTAQKRVAHPNSVQELGNTQVPFSGLVKSFTVQIGRGPQNSLSITRIPTNTSHGRERGGATREEAHFGTYKLVQFGTHWSCPFGFILEHINRFILEHSQ